MDALRAYVAALPEARGSGDALASMYADLGGQRASDPNAFRTKVDWWSRTLRDIAWHGLVTNALSLALDDALLTGLARPSTGRPMCVAVVMVRWGTHVGGTRAPAPRDAPRRLSRPDDAGAPPRAALARAVGVGRAAHMAHGVQRMARE
ncbi:hypothetical protein GLX27_003577 [Malassezia furfur]|uniref:Uncharacterized protein n=1 Tax=Malassezia furfur TaxID=55194 RepID=A0ABY8EUU3_MALFU|nr:hypothetical protein GLX27_003577 [Malassezia furfur]